MSSAVYGRVVVDGGVISSKRLAARPVNASVSWF